MGRLKVSRNRQVTQITSKATAVECSSDSGIITLNNAALGATTSVNFTVNNGFVGPNDTIVTNIASGATAGSYTLNVDAVAAGSFRCHLRNVTAGSLGEALVITFSVVKNG